LVLFRLKAGLLHEGYLLCLSKEMVSHILQWVCDIRMPHVAKQILRMSSLKVHARLTSGQLKFHW